MCHLDSDCYHLRLICHVWFGRSLLHPPCCTASLLPTCLPVVSTDLSAPHAAAWPARYGFWNNKRIVLYDTLLKHCSEDQVVAVLAHELGECLHGWWLV